MAKSRAAHAPQSCPAGVPLIVRGWQLCYQPLHLCCQPQTHIDIRHTNTESPLLSGAGSCVINLCNCVASQNKHKIRGPPYYQGLAASVEPTWCRGPLFVKKHQFEHPGGQHISEPGAFCGPATT